MPRVRDAGWTHATRSCCTKWWRLAGRSSTEPVSWDALVLLGELLDAVRETFAGFDSLLPHAWFHQCLTWDGRWLDHETPLEALDNPFWQELLALPPAAGRTAPVTTRR